MVSTQQQQVEYLMDKNIVSDIKNKIDTYYALTVDEGAKVAEEVENYLCERLVALLEEGATYSGVAGLNGEWKYTRYRNGYYNFAPLAGKLQAPHPLDVDWQDIADCIEELQLTANGLVAETGCSI